MKQPKDPIRFVLWLTAAFFIFAMFTFGIIALPEWQRLS